MQSIAEYTGIPRETVRRKLAALERKDWIARDERGHITATGAASADLSEATRHAMDYLATLSKGFDVARKAPDADPSSGRSTIAQLLPRRGRPRSVVPHLLLPRLGSAMTEPSGPQGGPRLFDSRTFG